MKKQTVLACACLVLGILAICMAVWAVEPCQIPSASTKACYDPDDAIVTCDGIIEADCVANRLFVYEINQFPDGTTPSATGATKTESTNCYRPKGCDWDSRTATCTNNPTWQTWRVKQKTVVNPDVQCPAE